MIRRLRVSLPILFIGGFTWAFAIVLFFVYRYWEGAAIDMERIKADFPVENFPLLRIALEAFLFGVLSEVLEIVVFRQRFKTYISSTTMVALRTAGHFVLFITYLVISLSTRHYINFQNFDGAIGPLLHIFQNGYYAQLIFFFLAILFITGVFRQLYHLVGPLNFQSFILGRYRVPREEERIFLFFDLNSSTSLAEQLGNKKYSRLLQDCFTDLSDLSYTLRAQTYQYVGDEAVFTWPKKVGYRHQRCLKLFFRYKKRLEKNEKYYQKQYGVTPTFKAALHCGKTIGAEVGMVKTEIAFHGDVVNTTSRILEKCHEVGEEFLVSGDVVKDFKDSHKYKFIDRGSAELRGKNQPTSLYGVEYYKS